ncbi:MAG: C4-dicarboxylate transporter DcuC [Methylobacteriaceae bacterium]|jgi:DcuC family C4-dicarboxylate transporter|nr:C4-dicarboxylate transporter DcuC [Methylobacteriaceae bacterium]
MVVFLGVLIVCGAIFLLVKRYEARMVLLGAGLLMGVVSLGADLVTGVMSGKVLLPLAAFQKSMTNTGLLEPILSVAGFSLVMRFTKCDAHLIHLLAGVLKGGKFVLVPAATVATLLINTSLPSAAGVAAAVGAIFIPVLISMGVNPAMAGAAVMAGTFGSMLSPGLMHNPFVAKLANVDVLTVIAGQSTAVIVAGLIGAVSLGIIAVVTREHTGYVAPGSESAAKEEFHVNPLYAVIPLLPLVLLVVAGLDWSAANIPWIKKISIGQAMLLGALLGIAVTRMSPSEACKSFFNGMGDAYGMIMGIIIAAGVFVGGMNACGIVDAGMDYMKSAQSIVRIAGAWGPFILAVITGSGDAAALAFNEAVTPHAAEFGQTIMGMGSMAALGGALGRTMSPLAGACLVCAGLANVSPFEIAKRNAPGMIVACLVSMFLLM